MSRHVHTLVQGGNFCKNRTSTLPVLNIGTMYTLYLHSLKKKLYTSEVVFGIKNLYLDNLLGLGGLKVTCSPRDVRFAGSNPAEVDGFFQDVKILSISSPGGTLSWGFEV